MSGFFVRFWGVRGSIPTPGHATQRYGGNTACIEVRVGNTLFILDGGSGLRPLGADLLRRNLDTIDAHMLFSHSHWDHIQGFPFFVPAYNPKTTIQVYGTEGDSHIFDLLSGQMQDKYFPVQLKVIWVRKSQPVISNKMDTPLMKPLFAITMPSILVAA